MMQKILLVMTMLFLFTNTAYAGLMTYFGEDIIGAADNKRLLSHPLADGAKNSFFSNLSGVGTEDFEGFAPGTTPMDINFPGAGTADFGGFAAVVNLPNDPNVTNLGRYPISGNQYLDSGNFFHVEFDQQISAFGFYATDVGDNIGQVTLETSLNGVSKSLLTIPTTTTNPGGTVIYYGFIDVDNPFDKVVFGNTSVNADFFGFDDFTIGTTEQVVADAGNSPVPEPATLFLVSFGLIGLGALRRRFSH
jgi:hypothetical protein